MVKGKFWSLTIAFGTRVILIFLKLHGGRADITLEKRVYIYIYPISSLVKIIG